ncbi:MAG TPA: pantetheine-phosphate adenylyltransferase [Gemmataceae bacterium]|nr:pantetheine-phosphate adenylyltransferase [Gemmataceae bacterium]
MPTRVAVYPGVFDPVHYGHLDIIDRGANLVDRLIVAVGDNPEKMPLFNQEERVELVKQAVKNNRITNVEVLPFHGLVVRFVSEIGARIMLRGIRTTSDMEYEFTMTIMNGLMDPNIETIFLMAHQQLSHVSGTLLRQIATMGGNLDPFLPPDIRDALIARATQRRDHLPPAGRD